MANRDNENHVERVREAARQRKEAERQRKETEDALRRAENARQKAILDEVIRLRKLTEDEARNRRK